MNNNMLIDKTVDITISKMNSSNIAVDENGGKNARRIYARNLQQIDRA